MRSIAFLAVCFWPCLVASAPAGQVAKPAHAKKIVLIAGALDKNHPAGTHEYEKSVRLLKRCLDSSSNVKDLRVETHFNGWPVDEKTLDDADTIVLISSGSDRNEKDHPLLVADRLSVIGKQMKRGCGLVMIHWTTFFPNERAGEQALEWVGGYFDYQSGPAPRRWFSAIQHVTTSVRPGNPEHPICRGIEPFQVREEFYYKIRFRDKDPRRKPILLAKIPGEAQEQVVAWAVQRGDGGRGFGFTGGHYFDNWWLPGFRKLVLNAIVWTAGAEVPSGGVESSVFEEADPAWTPRVATGNVPAWEKATDKDWVDGRFRAMDTGPFLNATIDCPSWLGKTRAYRGTAIRVGPQGDAAVLFDRSQMRLAAGWSGGFLQHSDRRFGLLNTPTAAGAISFATAAAPGWADRLDPHKDRRAAPPPTVSLPRDWAAYRGLYLHGDRTLLSYSVAGAGVLESPWLDKGDGIAALTRTLEIEPAATQRRLLVCDFPTDRVVVKAFDDIRLFVVEHNNSVTAVGLAPEGVEPRVDGRRLELLVPAQQAQVRVKLLFWQGPARDLPKFAALVRGRATPEDLGRLTKPGPARWTTPIVTRGALAADTAPYVVDTLTVPYENPHKALMFISGVDFLPNADIAVCTAHGDVWIVRGADDKLEKLTWKRFATGLYQPLGLKVVKGLIHVLERGQLTRLHDLNGDGEADFYENLSSDWHVGGGEHSYDTCLETDAEGNFYFFKTGDGHTPTGGCLMRISSDGTKTEVFATGFRHPIGLGISPDGIITGADQEGNWMPATRLDEYRQGGFYGDMRTHHRQAPPKLYDPPLCWLPREMDNSAGGQVWLPKDSFGPLGGRMVHLSYGRCKAMLVLREQIGDTVQGGVVDLGWRFLSGAARARFHPKDGHLYVVGLNGWQTAAARDGSLQRVRYTKQPVILPIDLKVHADGIRLTFTQKLDAKSALDPERYRLEQWNYHWSEQYGSKRWSVAHPDKQGQDPVPIRAVKLLDDGRGVFLDLGEVRPAMQMQINYALKTAAGENCTATIFNTIHRTRERFASSQ